MKKLIYVLCICTIIQINSQEKKERILYDVNKVYIQLNEVSGEIVTSSDRLILLQNKNFFAIWSARDKRKMYDFSVEGQKIKALFAPNSKYIIFFIKKSGTNNFYGKLEVETGIYQEIEIKNKTFTPLEIKSTFRFDSDTNELLVFSNNKLWNINILNFELNQVLDFKQNLEPTYKDFLFTTESQICFKIESDIKKTYFAPTQLRPAQWKLDSIMLFDKKKKMLLKVKLEEKPLGVFSHRNTRILIDYENKITDLDILSLKEKSYTKKPIQKVYKTLKEEKNTHLILGAKDLKIANEIKSDSLQKAFEKSREDNFDLFLYKRNLSPFNLLTVHTIDDNFKYKKGNTKLPIKFYWNPCSNYFPTEFGVVYDRPNGIFSYFHKVEKSQRWNIDYTREGLTIYERLSLNDSGDFTFYGYGYGNELEVINISNDDKFSNVKEGLKNRHFLNNSEVLSGYQNQEKKNIYHLELTDGKGKEIWRSEPIETKIKGDINTSIFINQNQTKGYLLVSPNFYSKKYKTFSYFFDLKNRTVERTKNQHGFFITEDYSFSPEGFMDQINIFKNNSKKKQKIDGAIFLTALDGNEFIYKDIFSKENIIRARVTDNGVVDKQKYFFPNKGKITANFSPFHYKNEKVFGVIGNELMIWELDKKAPIKIITLNHNYATYITGSNKQLFIYHTNGSINILDLKTLEIISTVTIHKKNGILYKAFFNKDLKFMVPKEIIKEYHFVKDLETFPLASYELFLNRPDVILSSLGHTDPKLIDVYNKAFLKRIKNSGFSEDTDFLSIRKPKVSLLNRDTIAFITKSQFLSLDLEVDENLDELLVYVNGVPVLKKKPNKKNFEETILLSNGINKISILGLDANGIESDPINLEIRYENIKKSKVHYFGIGVSKYKDNSMNLKFADTDVRSLSKFFGTKFKDRISIDTLNNFKATKENILAFKKKLLKTNINDIVIISFSGHGLVDDNNDFYFATHNIDFNNPQKEGLSYDDIQSLVDNIPARKKLLLIDACHSGELDSEEISTATTSSENVKAYLPQGAKGTITKSNRSSFKTSFEIMKSSFNNSNRGNGAFVISAAGGKEYAFESKEWGNGVFTYSLIKAMQELTLDDYNYPQSISISMLRDYIYRKVKKLTNNQQKPTSRSENLEFDWVLIE